MALHINAQAEKSYRFTHLTLEDGLADNWCHDALMDGDGYMWFATQDGLSRYNASNFTNFQYIEEDTFSLGGNIVMELLEDSALGLWAATNGGGLNYFDPETQHFIRYQHDPVDSNSLSVNTVVSLFQDKEGVLWIGTYDGGFNRFDPLDNSFTRYALNDSLVRQEDAFYRNSVLDIVADPLQSDRLWLAANDGLYSFDKNNAQLKHHGGPEIDGRVLNCHEILTGNNGDLWIAIAGAGICHYEIATGIWSVYPPQTTYWKAGNPYANLVFDLEWKSTTELWFVHRNLGLGVFDIKEKSFEFVSYDPTDDFSIISDEGFSIYKDYLNRLWFLSFRKGVSFLDPAYQMFNYTGFESSICPTMVFNETRDFAKDERRGKTYVVAQGCDGLYVYNQKMQLIDQAPCALHPTDLQEFTDVLLDSRGGVWVISTNDWGDAALLQYDEKSGYCIPFKHPDLQDLPLHQYRLTDIAEDEDQNLWLSTDFEGLIKIDFEKDTIIQYVSEQTGQNQFDRTIESSEILIDSEGRIWISTLTNGVFSFDPNMVVFTQFGSQNQSWRDSRTHTLAEDKLGRIWVGTNTNGIQIIDPKDISKEENRLRVDGLPAEQITKIRRDANDDMWVATLKGLTKFDTDQGLFLAYGKQDGLEDIFLLNKGLSISGNNQLFLGQNLGFYHFHIDSLYFNNQPPPVHLTYLKVFEKEKQFEKELNYIDQINLGYEDNFLTIGFNCLNYSASEKNRYAYQLIGLDQDWVYPQEGQNFASYTNLNPGNYTFKVKAANNDGVWNEEGHQLDIYISPPFWQRPWFYALCILLIGSGLYFFYRWRLRVNSEKARIGKQLVELELKALKAQMNPHFIFNSLNAIKMLVQLDRKEQAGDYLSQFSKMIRGVLQYSDRKIISLSEELEISKLFLSMESLRFQDKFDYKVVLDPNINSDLINVPALIFQPYLENAIWHGLMHLDKKGELTLSIEQVEQQVLCIIEDNGIGREMAQKLKLKRRSKHKSVGMNITQERLRLTQKLNKTQMGVQIIDKTDHQGNSTGTKVIIRLS